MYDLPFSINHCDDWLMIEIRYVMTLLASPEQRIYELSRRIDRRIAAFREMSESAEKIRFQASLASQNAVAAMTHQITSGAFSQFAPPFRSVPIR